MYVRNQKVIGRNKIQDLWLSVPYWVVERLGADKPVYTLVLVDAAGPSRNVHRSEVRRCGTGVRGADEGEEGSESEESEDDSILGVGICGEAWKGRMARGDLGQEERMQGRHGQSDDSAEE